MKMIICLFFIVALTACVKKQDDVIPGLYCNKSNGAGIIVTGKHMDSVEITFIQEGACSIGG